MIAVLWFLAQVVGYAYLCMIFFALGWSHGYEADKPPEKHLSMNGRMYFALTWPMIYLRSYT